MKVKNAKDLIADIFSRPQRGVPFNVRRISPDQRKYLRDLIALDAESAAVSSGELGSLVWSPAGQYKYILAEGINGGERTLTRSSVVDVSETGSLF